MGLGQKIKDALTGEHEHNQGESSGPGSNHDDARENYPSKQDSAGHTPSNAGTTIADRAEDPNIVHPASSAYVKAGNYEGVPSDSRNETAGGTSMGDPASTTHHRGAETAAAVGTGAGALGAAESVSHHNKLHKRDDPRATGDNYGHRKDVPEDTAREPAILPSTQASRATEAPYEDNDNHRNKHAAEGVAGGAAAGAAALAYKEHADKEPEKKEEKHHHERKDHDAEGKHHEHHQKHGHKHQDSGVVFNKHDDDKSDAGRHTEHHAKPASESAVVGGNATETPYWGNIQSGEANRHRTAEEGAAGIAAAGAGGLAAHEIAERSRQNHGKEGNSGVGESTMPKPTALESSTQSTRNDLPPTTNTRSAAHPNTATDATNTAADATRSPTNSHAPSGAVYNTVTGHGSPEDANIPHRNTVEPYEPTPVARNIPVETAAIPTERPGRPDPISAAGGIPTEPAAMRANFPDQHEPTPATSQTSNPLAASVPATRESNYLPLNAPATQDSSNLPAYDTSTTPGIPGAYPETPNDERLSNPHNDHTGRNLAATGAGIGAGLGALSLADKRDKKLAEQGNLGTTSTNPTSSYSASKTDPTSRSTLPTGTSGAAGTAYDAQSDTHGVSPAHRNDNTGRNLALGGAGAGAGAGIAASEAATHVDHHGHDDKKAVSTDTTLPTAASGLEGRETANPLGTSYQPKSGMQDLAPSSRNDNTSAGLASFSGDSAARSHGQYDDGRKIAPASSAMASNLPGEGKYDAPSAPAYPHSTMLNPDAASPVANSGFGSGGQSAGMGMGSIYDASSQSVPKMTHKCTSCGADNDISHHFTDFMRKQGSST